MFLDSILSKNDPHRYPLLARPDLDLPIHGRVLTHNAGTPYELIPLSHQPGPSSVTLGNDFAYIYTSIRTTTTITTIIIIVSFFENEAQWALDVDRVATAARRGRRCGVLSTTSVACSSSNDKRERCWSFWYDERCRSGCGSVRDG